MSTSESRSTNDLVRDQRRAVVALSRAGWITQRCRPVNLRWSVKVVESGGSFLAGDQSGDRAQDRVQVLASAQVMRQGPPVPQVADAMLHADPPRDPHRDE